MNILIVDDNPTNRKLLRVTLEAEGFITLEATDGVEALATLEEHPVEAIISDILMPRMDGFRLCHEVRKQQRFDHLPFIIYSATYTTPGDEKLALDSGADRYLRKPCPVPVMVTAIQEVAREAQQRQGKSAPLPQELQVMREYNEALVRKLEERNAELEQQREWLRVTLTSIGDAVIATDTAGRITFLNPVAEALTGWPQHEALGRPIQEVFNNINEKNHQQAEDIVGRVLREGCIVRLANDTALVARDGRRIPIEDSAAPIKDSAGQVSGVVLVFHDVSEKRRAQEALRASEERLRRLLEAVKDYAIFMLDPEGRVASWNSGAEQTKGYGADEILGQPFSRFYTPEDLAQGRPMQELAIAREQGKYAEQGWRIRKDGSRFWADVTITAIRDEDGRLRGFSKVTCDTTERKKAEEELRSINEELTRFNRAAVGRELRMIELKKEVNELYVQTGQPPRYALEFEKETGDPTA